MTPTFESFGSAVVYARRDNPDIRFGEVLLNWGPSATKDLMIGTAWDEDDTVRKHFHVNEDEIYFQGHPDGYNQPCFESERSKKQKRDRAAHRKWRAHG